MSDTQLEVKNISVSFSTQAGKVHAVRNVSFSLHKGETLAIVGESGSGKTVTCRAIMRLLSMNASIDAGEILLEGMDILKIGERTMRHIRGNDIAMVFQDPMTSLDPTMKIGRQIEEAITLHKKVSRREARNRMLELLRMVGIEDSKCRSKQYPHEFSGGQRQRIVIAMVLACNPKVLIADEPTTALDVTMQAQIIDLLKALQKKINTSIIFITHDLGVVANVADRVAVMYAGRIVEIGQADEIFYDPRHPYTWGLLKSMPTLDMNTSSLYTIPGSPPNLLKPSSGDAFAPRNEYAMAVDELYEPPLFRISNTHYAATWLLDERAPAVNPPAALRERREEFLKRSGLYEGNK
ncbi:oligopeptide transport system ATP-binding protein [Anaerocolumna jejuensis DSM 15929]|uniref:Oligopeptide transport system ATP-binding protein n=1 Tax=Anaerocolumna jejuensis DSM 15929 TaxID=1121322 RepID=A0A1M6TXL2_9FIRM|nr:ABC transporter ATP-binding protein [Anaerocolumna jejuensis]SHK61676.1 oligopeptide transport system ATP-binding protein [Anaerocolumna jejuensis DSM 15929]